LISAIPPGRIRGMAGKGRPSHCSPAVTTPARTGAPAPTSSRCASRTPGRRA
jgi:hypothetical protein